MRNQHRFAGLLCLLLCACRADLQPAPVKPDGVYRIALVGCIRQFEPAPALTMYAKSKPDLTIWVGDNIYADTDTDVRHIAACYTALSKKPGFAELMSCAPYAVTWDDHDYGNNNADRRYPLRHESRALFLDFWSMHEHVPAQREGIYHARYFDARGKRLQVILLDVRTHRDPPNTGGDILGQAQWDWLATELRKPADLRLIVSGSQVLLSDESGSETWEHYPAAQGRLFRLIRESGADGVVLITGDQHHAEVCRLRGVLDTDAIELQFAGVNQGEKRSINHYRVSPVAEATHKYALLDLVLEPGKRDTPHLLFRVFNAETGHADLAYRINLDELIFDVAMTGRAIFLSTHAVELSASQPGMTIRYTIDGSDPTPRSPAYTGPIRINQTTTVSAALFAPDGNRRGQTRQRRYERVEPTAPVSVSAANPGVDFNYYEGEFQALPDFSGMSPIRTGRAEAPSLEALSAREDHFAAVFTGLISVPRTGLYRLDLRSDDGSRLYLHDVLLIDNDGSHSPRNRQGWIALTAGQHPFRLEYFEDYMGQVLELSAVTINEADGTTSPATLKFMSKH